MPLVFLHAHFDENQFENRRADGKKRLRPDAIPMIFSHRPTPSRRATTTSRRSAQSFGQPPEHHVEHPYANLSKSPAKDGGEQSTSSCDELENFVLSSTPMTKKPRHRHILPHPSSVEPGMQYLTF